MQQVQELLNCVPASSTDDMVICTDDMPIWCQHNENLSALPAVVAETLALDSKSSELFSMHTCTMQ